MKRFLKIVMLCKMLLRQSAIFKHTVGAFLIRPKIIPEISDPDGRKVHHLLLNQIYFSHLMHFAGLKVWQVIRWFNTVLSLSRNVAWQRGGSLLVPRPRQLTGTGGCRKFGNWFHIRALKNWRFYSTMWTSGQRVNRFAKFAAYL